VPLSSIQKGAIGQFAFLATAIVTGKGQLEVYTPAIDNEGRDAEVRRHLRPTPGIGIQVKVAFRSLKLRHSDYLEMWFPIREKRVQNDPRLWYFFAVFDHKELRLRNPGFLIRSDVFHKMARRNTTKGHVNYSFIASLEPDSRDRWRRFRVLLSDLGPRLLEIVDGIQLTAEARSAPLPTHAIVLGRKGRRTRVGRRIRAA
jgi:hypothetical protein